MNKTQKCRNISLAALYDEVNRLLSNFDVITFKHVCGERNGNADRLSKAGLHMEPGTWKFLETKEVEVYEFFHRPFIDPLPGVGRD